MSFIALHIRLLPTAHEGVSLTQEHSLCPFLYRTLHSLLRENDGERVPTLRSEQDGTWITVALMSAETTTRSVRVTFLGQNAFRDVNALLNILVTHPELDVGQWRYLIQSVDLGHEPWSAVSTWADMTRPSVARFIHLRIVTPMTMRGPSTDTGSTPYFPRPLPLFSELLRHWQQLAGPPLHDEVTPYLQRRGCVVADYRLLTQDVMLTHGKLAGLLGWIIYECREQHAACIGALNMLARLASYTGVGFYTELGMGAIQLVEGG